jgi:hypothetical protein
MIGRNGDTVERLRELIAVPPEVEATLRNFARVNPKDAPGVERVLRFRELVLEEFDRLVAQAP